MKIVLEVLRGLLGSKKFVAMIVGLIATLVAKIGWDVPEETIAKVVALIASYIIGQGVADAGKERAKIEAAAKE